jgi:hypothetical protein
MRQMITHSKEDQLRRFPLTAYSLAVEPSLNEDAVTIIEPSTDFDPLAPVLHGCAARVAAQGSPAVGHYALVTHENRWRPGSVEQRPGEVSSGMSDVHEASENTKYQLQVRLLRL